ncbi:MAG: LysR family transcriptional regulator [Lachnospiraceae bacterium]|nr:LysR family transcriptional regulator [Lachnospiraceae bacterium]
MTFEQLEYFIAVAETDTFYTAADILHMTQSALSKQIMKLEKELDVQLFDRTHRSAQLTYAGKVFYEEAQKLVLQYRKTLNRMEHIKSPVGEALAIGTLPVLDAFGLRRPLHEFKTRHTESRITIDEVEEQELMFGLDSDIYDFVIGNEYMFAGRAFTLSPFGEDELIAIFPEGREPDRPVPLAAMADHPLCLLNSYTATCQLCLRLFKEQGLAPEILRSARVGQILQFVRSGDAFGLISRMSLACHPHGGVTAISLDPPVKYRLVFAARDDSAESLLIRQLQECLRSSLQLS